MVRGRNSIFLARNDFSVDAIDVSPVALRYGVQESIKSNLSINWVLADLMVGFGNVSANNCIPRSDCHVSRFVSNDLLESLLICLLPLELI